MPKTFKALLFLFFIFAHAHAADPLAGPLQSFANGEYVKAISELQNLRFKGESEGARLMLLGLAYNRTQEYDKSVGVFSQAEKLKKPTGEFYYEFGQALYASNELRKAAVAFDKSYKSEFKVSSSLYYMAHVSQLLEDHRQAKKYFEMILKLEKDDKNTLQASRYQLAESLLALLEEKDSDKERIVEKYILPQLKLARDELPRSALAKDISDRIKELERQFGLDPNIMKNGRILPEKRWTISFSEELRHDSNITLATDVPSSAATQKESFISDTQFYAATKINWGGRVLMSPDFRAKKTHYTDRANSDVFKNDSHNITGSLKNSYETTAFDQRASWLFDYDYNYIARDKYSRKEILKYAYSLTYTLGYRFRPFNVGDTTFKFKSKDYKAVDQLLNNKTTTIQLDQSVVLSGGKLLILFFSYDKVDNYNSTRDSTNSTLFRIDHITPELYPSWMMNLSFSLTLLDTLEQSTTRGTEKTYTPGIKFTKNVTKNLTATFGYEYTKNDSLDENSYAYTKNVVSFEMKLQF